MTCKNIVEDYIKNHPDGDVIIIRDADVLYSGTLNKLILSDEAILNEFRKRIFAENVRNHFELSPKRMLIFLNPEQNGWVKASVKMPDREDFYHVVLRNGTRTIGKYIKNTTNQDSCFFERDNGAWVQTNDVVAWYPAPPELNMKTFDNL